MSHCVGYSEVRLMCPVGIHSTCILIVLKNLCV